MNCPLCQEILDQTFKSTLRCRSGEHPDILFKYEIINNDESIFYQDIVTIYDFSSRTGVWINRSKQYIYRLNHNSPIVIFDGSTDINIDKVVKQFAKIQKLKAFL